MNFAEAFVYVLGKMPVTRTAWKDAPDATGHPAIIFRGGIPSISGSQTILQRDQNTRTVPEVIYRQTPKRYAVWLPSNEDLFAEDWEVYDFEE